ncbi:MAG: CoA transferase [Myxococcota bacterium]
MSASNGGGPLAGVRVLDLTRVVSGPVSTRILADLGADVIKVEAPNGDLMRRALPQRKGIPALFAQLNAGKRCICVDLAKPGGTDLLGRLAVESDVLVENFRPGVLARYGLDADTLLAKNPRLVYCSITGYGQRGVWAGRRAYAPLVHAEAGTLELVARKNRTPIMPQVQSHGDVYAAALAANAVVAALFERERSGRGQHLDVSMAEALLYTNEWTSAEIEGNEVPQLFGAWASAILRLSDGRAVAFAGNVAFNFARWAEAMGREDLLEDERFASPEACEANREAVLDVLQSFIGSFDDVGKLERALEPFDMPLGEVRSIQEMARTDWAEEREVFARTEEGIEIPRSPWRSSSSEIGTSARVSRRGADNRAVLSELLPDAEILRLEREGVLLADDG